MTYIRFILRKFLKEKLYTTLNILGFALGITSFLLVSLYVYQQESYDDFHKKKDKVYRVLRQINNEEGSRNIATTSYPYADALKEYFQKEVVNSTRVFITDGLVTVGEQSFTEERIAYVDSTFLDIFSYPLAKGNVTAALKDPSGIIITAEMAIKYFGDQDPMGKTIIIDNSQSYLVNGVFAQFPGETHLDFDFAASIIPISDNIDSWWAMGIYTYIELDDGIVEEEIESLLPDFMDLYLGDIFRRIGRKQDLTLEPLEEIYYANSTSHDSAKHGDKKTVIIFSMTGLITLILAGINFLNLSVVMANSRAREVGIRKLMGASKLRIFIQFLIEGLMFSIIATFISMILIYFGLDYFNRFIGEEIFIPSNPGFYLILIFAIIIGMSPISTAYPALVVSGFKPISAIKGLGGARHSQLIRKGLVIFQFGISTLLIISTIVIGRQLIFMNEKELGFDESNVLLVRLDNDEIAGNANVFMERVSAVSNVEVATLMSGEPGGYYNGFPYNPVNSEVDQIGLRTIFADANYLNTFGLELAEGRNFRSSVSDIQRAAIINEEAASSLGWGAEEAIGKEIFNRVLDDSIPKEIIGVVRDYHFTSLKNQIDPLIITLDSSARSVGIRYYSGQQKSVIDQLGKIYGELASNYPFEYHFLDQNFENMYRAEQQEFKVFNALTFVGIVIACLGLLGLAVFSMERKKKEIGVRKVLGADFNNLFLALTGEFIRLVVISSIVVIPLAIYLMNQWLKNFAYHIEMQVWMIVLGCIISISIAVLTVAYHAIKNSLINPVISLRDE